jgi:hypothetical protein
MATAHDIKYARDLQGALLPRHKSSLAPADYLMHVAYILKTLSYNRHKKYNKSPLNGNAPLIIRDGYVSLFQY